MIRWDENEMMSSTRGSLIYTPCRSVHPRLLVSPYTCRRALPMYFEAVIERVWRCTGSDSRASLEMHFEAVIERVWWCNWRPRLSELRDALGGCDRANVDMHLEVEIEWTQWCTRRLSSREFGNALAGYDRTRLEEYLEAVDLDGGAMAAETLFIS